MSGLRLPRKPAWFVVLGVLGLLSLLAAVVSAFRGEWTHVGIDLAYVGFFLAYPVRLWLTTDRPDHLPSTGAASEGPLHG